jgi:hypothetical protein
MKMEVLKILNLERKLQINSPFKINSFNAGKSHTMWHTQNTKLLWVWMNVPLGLSTITELQTPTKL